jgi:ketosteroid isomerase-like protein
LVTAFREGRWDDKFASFAEEATVVDGGRWFGSLDEYRTAWNRWVAKQDALPVPLSVETSVMKLQMLDQAAVLTHSIESRERTDAGEETVHEVETIVFGKQPDGRWLIVHQHLSPQPG